MTTGNGTVRFNPNLYNSGKVCLSLLGTWRGEQGESWNPDFLQLFNYNFYQSLIFIKDPYFNEPGWETDRGTKKGEEKSKKYSEIRELETIRWAINDKIINPVKGLEEFTKEHFRMKREELINVTRKWYNNCTQNKYKGYEEEIDKMIGLLDSLMPKEEPVKVNSGFEANNTFDYFESPESPVDSIKTDSSISEELLETISSEEELFEVKKD